MSRTKSVLLRAAAGLAAASLVLSACSQQSNTGTDEDSGGGDNKPSSGYPEVENTDISEGKPGGTFRLGIVEPVAIDPYNAQESEGILVAAYLFTGLTHTTPDGETEPAVAESWESNEDCSEWTFNLKTGTKFHDGEEVTSASFKRGWERVVAKASASDVAYHFDQIEGYEELNGGTANALSGVDASDPAVLKVKLAKPSCEFYIRTAHTAFSPMPKAAGAAQNQKFNDQPIGNGPFMMDGPWQHDAGIKLKRFDDYGAADKAYLDAVEITILVGDETAQQKELDGLNNGQFDWARIPPNQLKTTREKYEAQDGWISKKTFGIDFLLVAATKAPMDDVKARKAVSMAIDRDAIINGVFDGSRAPATSFVPGGFKDAYQPDVCDACKYDPEKAKQLAKEAGLTEGTELNFQFNTGGGHEEWTAAVKQQLEKNLGLKVNYSGVEFSDMLENQQQPNSTGIYRLSWGADYATPGNFLQPLFSTEAIGTDDPNAPALGDNRGRYSNPEFDDLVDEATATKDEAERTDLYRQAEKIAIGDDLANIPMFERQQFRAFDSKKWANAGFMDFHENPPLNLIYQK
ncbi:peptide ABC transporter substrate-binding protein [Actinophytocola xanthii]|uniref:peptide ABC transporter substrate-binding protein n=1 Tax=Actinophytocola xanthii TaxID=1912961 RepID=UPI000A67F932|nr:ABC transporter substrate-binding protein [Actinophytocola xanthii]